MSLGSNTIPGQSAANSLGSPVRDLRFTENGLEPFLNSARSNFLLGELSLACGQKEKADEMFLRSARASGPSDTVWAWASARKLDGYNQVQWRARLQAALSQSEFNLGTGGSSGWWLYAAGVLQIALGNTQKGKALLQESFLAPENEMSHHLSRLALAGATPQGTPQ